MDKLGFEVTDANLEDVSRCLLVRKEITQRKPDRAQKLTNGLHSGKLQLLSGGLTKMRPIF